MCLPEPSQQTFPVAFFAPLKLASLTNMNITLYTSISVLATAICLGSGYSAYGDIGETLRNAFKSRLHILVSLILFSSFLLFLSYFIFFIYKKKIHIVLKNNNNSSSSTNLFMTFCRL